MRNVDLALVDATESNDERSQPNDVKDETKTFVVSVSGFVSVSRQYEQMYVNWWM